MRITDIRETVVPLKSSLRNAAFDFSEMTTSVVAVITDVVRGGKPVVGYAFNSTGRYACGAQMRARFIPRMLEARTRNRSSNAAGDNLDPEKILAAMMQREKPGGHTERSIAIGTIEVAAGTPSPRSRTSRSIACSPSATTEARRRTRCSATSAAAGITPGKGLEHLQDEIRRAPRTRATRP